MLNRVIWFLKNDVVFWIFFLMLSSVMFAYILKKEDIKITITFGENLPNLKSSGITLWDE